MAERGIDVRKAPLPLRRRPKGRRHTSVCLRLVVNPLFPGLQIVLPHHLQQNPPQGRACCKWRRERDLNPRYPVKSTIDFESTAFDHSAISPLSYHRSCSLLTGFFLFCKQIFKKNLSFFFSAADEVFFFKQRLQKKGNGV